MVRLVCCYMMRQVEYAGCAYCGCPRSCCDLPDDSDDVVRVTLSTAVKFITDLQQSELLLSSER